ncbi:hypothetical protein [Reyranella sp.]|uniref:hypothetical protein n=1 Tax=Reyranella sp. TaxID=1929291 RepID=UPI003783BA1E
MRLRDIVRLSFAGLIAGGALPHYARAQRNGPSVDNDVRSNRRKVVHPAVPALGLYADVVAWRQAVDFIRAFTAAATAPRAQWQIPAWSGSFGDMPADDLLHHLGAGLAGCGLRPLASTAPSHMACFEAVDSPMVSNLPAPYGRWLEVQEQRSCWKERIDLRLVVCIRARFVSRPDGRVDALADIALSGPAIELMQELGTVLDRAPAPLALARWLPRPTPKLVEPRLARL